MLAEASVEEPRRTASLLLQFVLKVDPLQLLVNPGQSVSASSELRFFELVQRRVTREPLQYITGQQEFYRLEFEVTPSVLIPRPETELIVEAVLALNRKAAPSIIDVGTGSGCLAVTLVHEIPGANVIALDLSPDALSVAERNARRHGAEDRITFLQSDLFAALDGRAEKPAADFVVSNPPYVADVDWTSLAREVRDHEPRIALSAGESSHRVHRQLFAQSARYLAPAGYLVCEMGADQYPGILELVPPLAFSFVEAHNDLQGIPRTLVLRRL